MPAFVDHDAQLRAPGIAVTRGGANDLDLRGRRQAVVKLHPAAQGLNVSRGRDARGHDLIFLRDLVSRVGQPVGEVSVIGKQKQPGAVGVETADRKDPVA